MGSGRHRPLVPSPIPRHPRLRGSTNCAVQDDCATRQYRRTRAARVAREGPPGPLKRRWAKAAFFRRTMGPSPSF